MSSISSAQKNVLWTQITSLLEGIYLIIFGSCVYLLAFKQRRTATNMRFLVAAILLFVTATAELIVISINTYSKTSGNRTHEASVKQANLNNILTAIMDSLLTTNNLIADGILIWRCYAVWERRFSVIIVPLILLIAGTVCGYMLVVFDAQEYLLGYHSSSSEIEPPPEWFELINKYTYMNIAFWATSFVTNVLMTGLTASRIWLVTREGREILGKAHRKKYIRVVSMLVESGALYSVCLLLAVIFAPLPSQDTATTVTSAIISQVAGIVPTLIIVLVALGLTKEHSTDATSLSASMDFARHSAVQGRDMDSRVRSKDVELQISRTPMSTFSNIDLEFASRATTKSNADSEYIPMTRDEIV